MFRQTEVRKYQTEVFSPVRAMNDRLRNSGCGMMQQEMRFHSAPFTLRAGIYRKSRRIRH